MDIEKDIQPQTFLSRQKAFEIAEKFGTPCYVYSRSALEEQARKALSFPNAFGLTVRYAMKAASNRNILKFFDSLGIHIDASSSYEVKRAMAAGIAPQKISLSSQQMPEDIAEIAKMGVKFNACSLHQLECYAKACPQIPLGVRINPGLGSGGTNRTNVGGPASSFGIWHEFFPQIDDIVRKYSLKITRIHTHIGSGSDPAVWQKVAKMSMDTVERFKDVDTLDMGGGFKVARVAGEKSTDLQQIGMPIAKVVEDFAKRTGRKIHFEIEPGTFLLANSACVLCSVQDMCSTGVEGYEFVKTDSGMTDILRPSLYGAQHPIEIIQKTPSDETQSYIFCGHCCESGDILTPAPADPEALSPRLTKRAEIGDLCVIGGAGAYCSAMATKNYNSYPASPEVMLEKDGSLTLMRRRQSLESVFEDEI